MCIAQNSLIFRQSEGNNFSAPNGILINLHMHHHPIAIYKFHENPSIACYSMAEDWKQTLTFWKPKGNNSYIAKDIMTNFICIIVSSHIHEIWSIAYLNRNYIDPTDSVRTASDVNQPTVHWFCVRFLLIFRVSRLQKNYNWPVWFFSIGQLSLELG